MKKSFFAIISSIALFITLLPSAYANKYVNEAFVGKYLSAGATTSNYGELNVLTCTDTSVTVDFKFIKNDNQQLIYTCYEGVMSDYHGEVPFTVSYADGRFVANGIMKLTLTDWGITMSCDSDNQHLFDGTMKPQFVLTPYDGSSNSTQSTPPASISSNVSVLLNGEKMNFPEGISPLIINDSTYVPLRSVFDKMGINVYWDQYKKSDILNAQSITCTKNDTIVQFTRTFNDIGSNVWTLSKWVGENTDSPNFTRINITDLQPTIIENHSYIPLRVVSEAFGADVGWLHEQRTVTIDCDVTNAYKYDSTLIGNIEDFTQDIASEYITEDYREVKPVSTPYFSPQAKFYKYSAIDTWSNVDLLVFYGGFIEVYPVEVEDKEPFFVPVETPEDKFEIATDPMVEVSEGISDEVHEDISDESTSDTVVDTTIGDSSSDAEL